MNCTYRVEVPTERRVKRWGLSVQELVRDPIGRQVLETFLESEFSSENIRFWMAIQELKFASNENVDEKAQRIYEEFLATGAPCQVIISPSFNGYSLAHCRTPCHSLRILYI